MNRFLRWMDETRADRVARILKPHVQGATLDVGCWNGAVAKRLGHQDIVGIDVVEVRDSHVEVTRFDGVNIPFPDKTFDTVLCCTCLHHAGNPGLLLEEAGRVGRRIIVLEDSYDAAVERLSVQMLHVVSSRVVKMPYRASGFRSKEQWCRLFEEHGLKVASCTRFPGIQPLWLFLRHYLFVLEPK